MNDHYWRCFGCGITMSKDARKGTFGGGEDCDIIVIDDGFYHDSPSGKLCGPMRFCAPGRDNWEQCSTEDLKGYENTVSKKVRDINETIDRLNKWGKGG